MRRHTHCVWIFLAAALIASTDRAGAQVDELVVDVELAPRAPQVQSAPHCVTFELHDCDTGASIEIEAVLEFIDEMASATLPVPTEIEGVPVVFDCITARDRLHSLARTIDPLPVSGTRYLASFTAGEALILGNLNDDPIIDVVDYGAFYSQFAQVVGPQDCATFSPHADVSDDGLVSAADLTFIFLSFFAPAEPRCCGLPDPPGPVPGGATLSLRLEGDSSVEPGDLVDVSLLMSDLGTTEIVGYQASVWFDPSQLLFADGAYANGPFDMTSSGSTAISADAAGSIDLHSVVGWNSVPATGPQSLATLSFQALVSGLSNPFGFRTDGLPARLADAAGNAIAPHVGVQAGCLTLHYAGNAPASAGDPVEISLLMSNLGPYPVSGFQAFLDFDPSSLEFAGGSYTEEPFGFQLIPLDATPGGGIDLAAAINVFEGQTATSEDALLATLNFVAMTDLCAPPVGFRSPLESRTIMSDSTGTVSLLPVLVPPAAPDCTPSGQDVVVEPVDPTTGESPVTLNFEEVSESGTTTVTTVESGPGQDPPGFTIGASGVVYEITTTATFSGAVELCFDFADLGDTEAEEMLRLYQSTDGVTWVDVTVLPVDTVNNVICGSVESFSFFGVFQPVDDIFGACCFADGACAQVTGALCATSGGTYLGAHTGCLNADCVQPMGACCFPDGSCAELTESFCASLGASYQGHFVDCSGAACPLPAGGCCFPDDRCELLTGGACAANGGSFLGDFTDCSDPCPCASDTNDDGVVDVQDLAGVVVAWGPCDEQCPEDVDQSGVVDTVDLALVVLNWGPCP